MSIKTNCINKMVEEKKRKMEKLQREIDIVTFWSMAKKYGFLEEYHIPNIETYQAMKEVDEGKAKLREFENIDEVMKWLES